MTYVKSYISTCVGGNNRRYCKEVIILKCDHCGNEYTCDNRYKTRAKSSNLHFCCKSCSSQSFTNGKLKDVTNATILNRYDGYFVTTKSFKESQRDLCMSLYGVPSRLEASEILSKIEKTNIAKYGKPTFAGSDQHVRSLDYSSISEKAWRTKIRNGSCSKSLPEEVMNQYLIDFYGVSNVQRQVKVLTQWVDFYVPITDTFIQVDGVYYSKRRDFFSKCLHQRCKSHLNPTVLTVGVSQWHGLNRSAEVIKLQKTSQDKKIYKQVLRDERLNMYCKDNGIKLIRITDNDIRVKTKEEIYAML